jgi:hypothetical protein
LRPVSFLGEQGTINAAGTNLWDIKIANKRTEEGWITCGSRQLIISSLKIESGKLIEEATDGVRV